MFYALQEYSRSGTRCIHTRTRYATTAEILCHAAGLPLNAFKPLFPNAPCSVRRYITLEALWELHTVMDGMVWSQGTDAPQPCPMPKP